MGNKESIRAGWDGMSRCGEVAVRRVCFSDSREEAGTQPGLPEEGRALEGAGSVRSTSEYCDSLSSQQTHCVCSP